MHIGLVGVRHYSISATSSSRPETNSDPFFIGRINNWWPDHRCLGLIDLLMNGAALSDNIHSEAARHHLLGPPAPPPLHRKNSFNIFIHKNRLKNSCSDPWIRLAPRHSPFLFTPTVVKKARFYGYFYLIATEVRCQEKNRGGLCYEVILGEPDVKFTPPKRNTSPKNKNVSAQDIEEKLRAAEERRQVLATHCCPLT